MADSGEFWGGVILSAAIVGCVWWYQSNKTEPPAPLVAGRFVVSEVGGQIYLTDSATGLNWRRVYDHLNEKGIPVGWQWELTSNPDLEIKRSLSKQKFP